MYVWLLYTTITKTIVKTTITCSITTCICCNWLLPINRWLRFILKMADVKLLIALMERYDDFYFRRIRSCCIVASLSCISDDLLVSRGTYVQGEGLLIARWLGLFWPQVVAPEIGTENVSSRFRSGYTSSPIAACRTPPE